MGFRVKYNDKLNPGAFSEFEFRLTIYNRASTTKSIKYVTTVCL